jgi:curli biogenesis system outer membrane secretion channel CsgG
MPRKIAIGFLVTTSLALAACQSETTMGTNQGPVTGAAGPQGGVDVSAQLERCAKPLGIIALVESQDPMLQQSLAGYGLGSPLPVLRLLMQQSNCFMVVDRGQAMQTIMQERALTQSGEMRGGANMGQGQLVAADLALTPNIIFSGNTGGGRAVIGGAVAGGLRFTSAQSVLTLTDVRSGLQVSAAQGTATARDMDLGGALFGWGGGVGGALGIGGYSNTPEGKVISAALMDAYNNVVRTVRGMPPLPSIANAMSPQMPQPAATASTGGRSSGPASGMRYRVTGNVNLREGPGAQNPVVGQLRPGTVVTSTGTVNGEWWEIQSGEMYGWVLSRSLRQN